MILSGVFIFCGGRYKLAKLAKTYQTKALKKYFRKPTWLNPFCSVLTIGLTSGRKNNHRECYFCMNDYIESLFVKEDEQTRSSQLDLRAFLMSIITRS